VKTSNKSPQPQTYNAHGLSRIFGLGCSRFARHYSGNDGCSLFLRVLRCFSSPRSPLLPMDSAADIPTLLGMGFPIQRSPDQSLFSGSPKLIAAYHVFRRLLAPRHPPCALSSLTIKPFTPIQLSKSDYVLGRLKASPISGGGERTRTDDLLRAKQALSQSELHPQRLLVGLDRFELSTSRLSGVRSNQLSYRPFG
jgi:hypothetical protein